MVAPIYPIAFTVICFAILGAPRTSRQSRELSIIMAIVAVGALRLIGFACNVFAAQIGGRDLRALCLARRSRSGSAFSRSRAAS